MPQTQHHATTPVAAAPAVTEQQHQHQQEPAGGKEAAAAQSQAAVDALTPIHQGFSIPTVTTATGVPSGTGFKKTFYKRKLPSPPAIEFSCPEGRQVFQEALLDGTMSGFFKLMEQFNTQDEPAFCGLASLAMTLNALSIDPRRTWKGSWRWFHEAMLDCCRPLEAVKEEGITLYQASCLARCNGARVELVPYGAAGLSLERFRREVEAVCASGEEHIVVSYSRKAFLQTGDGHFSPIGGYHRGRDLVLVLDVARFKYPPHWVPLPMLYHAMSYVDKVTGRPRGFMRLASNPLLDSVLLTCDVRSPAQAWRPAEAFVRTGATALVQELAAAGGLSAEAVVRAVVDAAPLASLDSFLVVRSGAPMAGPSPDLLHAAAAGGGGGAAAAASGSSSSGAGGHVCATPPPLSAVAAAAAVPVCETPEAMVAAVRRASEMGNAAAADLAAATAAASASAPGPGAGAGGAPPITAPAAPAAAVAAPAAQASGSKAKSCGSGTGKSSCGSGSCGSGSAGASTDAGGGSAAAAAAGGCSSSSLMAAATAIFTAHDRCIPMAQRQQLLDELKGMPLYGIVSAHLVARRAAAANADGAAGSGSGGAAGEASAAEDEAAAAAERRVLLQSEYLTEKVVMALLLQRPEAWPSAPPPPPSPSAAAQAAAAAAAAAAGGAAASPAPPAAPPATAPGGGPWGWADPAAGQQWSGLVALGSYSVVEAEAAYLREQLAHIDEVLQSGDVTGTCGEHAHRLDCAAHGH
ncbi:hypothetical protein HYH02_004919 [Chlamydomonas schloesseri]|uniref:glutathione gamma-glutamylcysteinyltransferase n=1 Tax=Chlamydomonas schloesseri TaxID=2026947 RepID=A0A835WML9_9CHLO|nr:hypothetical protein HYH02_004919 [Chlamydomonas schloesseri]|eukprot:KAG2450417.1 hypothetical protein HYH02_004919 [Chlamydomonas schloesseri]